MFEINYFKSFILIEVREFEKKMFVKRNVVI